MVNQQLISYIKKQLSQGYGINSVRLSLARSGYTPEQIEEAVTAAYKKPNRRLAKWLLLIGGGAVVMALLITVLILILSSGEVGPTVGPIEKGISLEISLEKTTFRPGEAVSFEIRMVNTGSESNFPVAVTNQILDSSGNEVAKEDEVVTLISQKREDYEISFSGSEGNYQVKTTIEFDGQTAERTASFRVTSAQELAEIGPAQTLTGDSVQAIEDIKIVAEADYLEAKRLCLTLETVLERDTCLLQTGLKIERAEFCSDIEDADKRDTCYLSLVLVNRDSNLCNQMTDEELKQSCLVLGG